MRVRALRAGARGRGGAARAVREGARGCGRGVWGMTRVARGRSVARASACGRRMGAVEGDVVAIRLGFRSRDARVVVGRRARVVRASVGSPRGT